MKIGVIAALAIGLFFVNPTIKMPSPHSSCLAAVRSSPSWWPYVFITIACGAISGFHSLIGSGTTPKMIEHETEITFIGYGAMLTEAFVSIMALLSAITLNPSDYYAINTSADVYAKLKMTVVDLPVLSQLVGLGHCPSPGWRHLPWPWAWPMSLPMSARGSGIR